MSDPFGTKEVYNQKLSLLSVLLSSLELLIKEEESD
jgi:hypothetical protein